MPETLRALRAFSFSVVLQNFYVFRLPALGAFGDGKFYSLAFWQAAKSAGLDRGEMHKHISIAAIAGNKSKTFCVVKPLHNSLFHCCNVPLFFLIFPAEKINWYLGGGLSLEGWTGSLTVGESLNWKIQYSTCGDESIVYSRNPSSIHLSNLFSNVLVPG
jgi:hypothetical protein